MTSTKKIFLYILCLVALALPTNGVAAPVSPWASESISLEEAKRLLKYPSVVNETDYYGFTPLMNVAWASGNVEVAEFLINNHADVDATTTTSPAGIADLDGITALMMAIPRDHIDIARLLIKKGANVNTKRHDGKTALMLVSCNTGQLEFAELLIENNADVFAKDSDGATALHQAIAKNNLEIAERLIKKKADVNARTELGITPLLIAIWNDKPDTVKFLLKNGADVNMRDEEGYTPLMAAVESSSPQVVELLLEKKPDVNAKNDAGRTALMCAAKRGHITIAELLLGVPGIEVNARDKDGTRALTLAKSTPELERLLKDKGAKE